MIKLEAPSDFASFRKNSWRLCTMSQALYEPDHTGAESRYDVHEGAVVSVVKNSKLRALRYLRIFMSALLCLKSSPIAPMQVPRQRRRCSRFLRQPVRVARDRARRGALRGARGRRRVPLEGRPGRAARLGTFTPYIQMKGINY